MTLSLDQIEEAQFHAKARPLDEPVVEIGLTAGELKAPQGSLQLPLDQNWRIVNGEDLNKIDFKESIPAQVPGSVHLALQKAGEIPDPKVGFNDAIALEQSRKHWWYRCEFERPQGMTSPELVFDGAGVRCAVYLNGTLLGAHEGMFGSWRYSIGNKVKDQNTLLVHIFPAPYEEEQGGFFDGLNVGWKRTVTFNCVYGWHYSDIPALGIWRPVHIEDAPKIKILNPFVATTNAQAGDMRLTVEMEGQKDWSGTLNVVIKPENFQGKSYYFQNSNQPGTSKQTANFKFQIPDPQLWWPNGMGAQNLYRCTVWVEAAGGGVPEVKSFTFGLRTVEMRPLPDGADPKKYNWTFVINGKPMFVKGTGWCTMDSSMDFSKERYDRFLSQARDQNCQMLRAWGGGIPETDDFYDLCDRYGLMVLQEWPTAWNSQQWQPYALLEETVRQNTLRLRNHPALVMWCGGNESWSVEDPIIDMMGRYSIELDGTRPFHRGEPRGGSSHDYECWWNKKPLDHNVTMEAAFFGEFGVASVPVLESVLRYLPDAEKKVWPPKEKGSFSHHTPVFNRKDDMVRLHLYADCFTEGKTMEEFIEASQVAQTVALRHTLERARARWPHCTGALYYKMNDNYPAVSWSTSDWYGAPKVAHYFCQNAFAPLHACLLLPKLDAAGEALSLPVFLLDDLAKLSGAKWEVLVRAFDGQLHEVKKMSYGGEGAIGGVSKVGDFALNAQQTATTPLLLVVEVLRDDIQADRTFYWMNYEAKKGSLFQLPSTALSLKVEGGDAIVTNKGTLPAVGTRVLRLGHLDTFTASENYFWLDPGESHRVRVNSVEGLTASAWNVE